MKPNAFQSLAMSVVVVALLGAGAVFMSLGSSAEGPDKETVGKPALTVKLIVPQRIDMAFLVKATGSVAAWQEASIGAESAGLRIAEVKVNVGNSVSKGQLLATFAAESVEADLALVRANLAEAEAAVADARANAARARSVQGSGTLSQQQITQLLTAEKTGEARLLGTRAQVRAQELRLQRTRVTAPDNGSISARGATVGAVVPLGMELFRLIRGDRLEWRAEVTSAEIANIRPGQAVTVTAASGASVAGRVRSVAPTVDPQTRNALVYVDLPGNAMRGGSFKPGMFARGEFVTGSSKVLTVPLEAISLRDGFSYVFTVSENKRAKQVKVQLGRRSADRVEVIGALSDSDKVVASGAAFLAEGDLVNVVTP